MKLIHATIAVAVTRLAIATIAVAQAPPEPITVDRIVPPRVELGTSAGLTIGFPELGLLASVPAGARVALECALSYMPPHFEGPAHQLAQVQVRVPFREHHRSRKSLTAGATYIAAVTGHDHGFLGSDANDLFPHAGVSLQWPLSRYADFRFDGQALLTFARDMPMIPRATATLVWHPGFQANNRRSQR